MFSKCEFGQLIVSPACVSRVVVVSLIKFDELEMNGGGTRTLKHNLKLGERHA